MKCCKLSIKIKQLLLHCTYATFLWSLDVFHIFFHYFLFLDRNMRVCESTIMKHFSMTEITCYECDDYIGRNQFQFNAMNGAN